MNKKKPLSPEHRAECEAANSIFLAKKNELKLSKKKVADMLGMSPAGVSLYLDGTNALNAKFAAAFAELIGEPVERFSPRLAEEIKRQAQTLSAPDRSGPDENGSPSKKDYALIPQYTARAAAGSGYHNDHVEMTEGLVFKREWLRRMGLKEDQLCVIYAHGNSMEPTISEGDVLLIDRAATQPVSGKVYAIQRPDGSHSIKRLVQSFAGDWTIVSDNQDKRANPDEPISAEALEHINIIGRSVWSGGGM